VKHGMSNSTVQRLRKDMPVSTHTLDALCKLLDCNISDIVEYVPDKPSEHAE
jgi:DNA-binding Xre family transcriptional regulator